MWNNSFVDICDQVCKNQPCPRKLHLVRYSIISPVLKEIFLFCKLYKLPHEFFHLWCGFHHVTTSTTEVEKCGDFCALTWLIFADLVTFANDFGINLFKIPNKVAIPECMCIFMVWQFIVVLSHYSHY